MRRDCWGCRDKKNKKATVGFVNATVGFQMRASDAAYPDTDKLAQLKKPDCRYGRAFRLQFGQLFTSDDKAMYDQDDQQYQHHADQHEHDDL